MKKLLGLLVAERQRGSRARGAASSAAIGPASPRTRKVCAADVYSARRLRVTAAHVLLSSFAVAAVARRASSTIRGMRSQQTIVMTTLVTVHFSKNVSTLPHAALSRAGAAEEDRSPPLEEGSEVQRIRSCPVAPKISLGIACNTPSTYRRCSTPSGRRRCNMA
jgi:hypothetical protein